MQQRCWACGSVAPRPQPKQDGSLPPLFQCARCGALNAPAEGGSAQCAAHPQAPQLLLQQPHQGRRPVLPTSVGRCLVAFVLLAIGAVFVLGVGLVLPALWTPPALGLHLLLAGLIAINVLFNYTACAVRRPGPVQRHLQQAALDGAGCVRRGALQGCSYCHPCAYYKPPAAHHCRSCACCVMEMDHHCWYLNNCVGAANLRHFLLFLGWVVAGVGYGLAMGLLMGWRDRAALWRHTARVLHSSRHVHPVARTLAFSLHWLMSAPDWVAAWAFFTFVCWTTLVCVGLLLARQLRLLASGQTYLGSFSRPDQAEGSSAAAADGTTCLVLSAPRRLAMDQARRVFGSSHPLLWLLPAWDVEPAAAPHGTDKPKLS